MLTDLRNVRHLALVISLVGSFFAGLTHHPEWLVLPPTAFLGLLVAEDRQLRHRVGERSWPSAGYVRFLFGTNLYLALRDTLFSAAIFALAATAGSLLAG